MDKKVLTISLIVVVLAVLPFMLPLAQAAPAHLDFRKQLSAKQCKTDGAKKIIEVAQKIVNDADSGVAGNAWAMDAYHRHIEVWQLPDNSFCAITKYDGKFVTLAGASPQNTGTVTAGVKGTFEGGYRSTIFIGTLLATPLKSTHGYIGTFNYQCDTSFNCPGYVDWTTFYFSSTAGFDLAWWGWIYHAGHLGTWVNSVDGNSGDITG
jgi:hypothetical protein